VTEWWEWRGGLSVRFHIDGSIQRIETGLPVCPSVIIGTTLEGLSFIYEFTNRVDNPSHIVPIKAEKDTPLEKEISGDPLIYS
jgi:hypothetical protein